MSNNSKIEICEIDCDSEDQPILYVNGKYPGDWKRVKCPDCKKCQSKTNT